MPVYKGAIIWVKILCLVTKDELDALFRDPKLTINFVRVNPRQLKWRGSDCPLPNLTQCMSPFPAVSTATYLTWKKMSQLKIIVNLFSFQ